MTPKWSPKSPNWLPKMMPTWLYRQDFAKFSLNRHYNRGPMHLKSIKAQCPLIAAYRNIFQAPVGPPPPGGVPVFPMAPGYYPPSSQTVVVNTTTGAQVHDSYVTTWTATL
ncbi:uncharacterized protein TNCV_5050321 [Trichonephila clavipes]|nr:uncharacterized protein TNCV_5050321 [Trichonephila clavipes]